MNINVGDTVYILNSSFSGKLIVEGQAKVKKILIEPKHEGDQVYATVMFDDGLDWIMGSDDRWIDPQAQDDPQAYCDELNKRMSAA